MESGNDIIVLENPSENELVEIMDFHNRNFAESQWSLAYTVSLVRSSSENAICAIIRKNEKIVGLALGNADKYYPEKMMLRSIAVDGQERGNGIGKKLLDFFIEKSFDIEHIKEIVLSFRESKKLENFYASFGFMKIETAGEYSNGDKKISMRLAK